MKTLTRLKLIGIIGLNHLKLWKTGILWVILMVILSLPSQGVLFDPPVDLVPFPWGQEDPIYPRQLKGLWLILGLQKQVLQFEPSPESPGRRLRAYWWELSGCQQVADGWGQRQGNIWFFYLLSSKGHSFYGSIHAFFSTKPRGLRQIWWVLYDRLTGGSIEFYELQKVHHEMRECPNPWPLRPSNPGHQTP